MPKEPPPGWGADELTKFIDATRNNQWATFTKKPAAQKLIMINAAFVIVHTDWCDPTNQLAALLSVKCHSAFRVAAGLAMAGQTVEAYVQCRAMLELAAYAVHIHQCPELAEVWLNRHQDEVSLKAQKRAFFQTEVVKSLAASDVDACSHYQRLYQGTIDLGAHPNERSLTANMKVVREAEKQLMLVTMQHGDGIQLDHALMFVARCGVVSLEMLRIVFHDRFETLGVTATIPGLQSGL